MTDTQHQQRAGIDGFPLRSNVYTPPLHHLHDGGNASSMSGSMSCSMSGGGAGGIGGIVGGVNSASGSGNGSGHAFQWGVSYDGGSSDGGGGVSRSRHSMGTGMGIGRVYSTDSCDDIRRTTYGMSTVSMGTGLGGEDAAGIDMSTVAVTAALLKAEQQQQQGGGYFIVPSSKGWSSGKKGSGSIGGGAGAAADAAESSGGGGGGGLVRTKAKRGKYKCSLCGEPKVGW
jgi:hypothetical protein